MRAGWTITNTYFATGEGMTHWLMYSFRSRREDALAEYVRRVDPYFAAGATIKEGIDLECDEARLLLSEPIKRQLAADDFGNAAFFAESHFNYS